ncbi:methyl-accepting chemotaxis sensory transducer [Cupriavidus sp. OV038]|jgi:twitching motility protein PilJ|uniref:methyl-accepting chemotaxis protein n=1 Tax=unclassified Cupriavidus TaxID=2640874 RepID=UPI0008E99313|nr:MULTISPECIES: methyl-accepting chemotaxis protein [unclassified Cupriavidus]SFD08609.1 methyl-accepting chemotaxis sensory transducer [Cupriavidus sp. OV038]SFP76947.1 methyl-accepting chemotaxis sensory transducer [Cupriavidus sp. OV096]
MGIKKMSLGRRTAAAGAAAEAVAPRRSVFAKGSAGADKGGLGRTPVEQLSGWLSRMPFASQQRTLTVGVVVSLVALLASVYLDNRQATNGAAQIEIAGNMLMHSQRLGKAVPVALLGNAQAFTQLRQSKEQLTADLLALQNGSDEKHVSATTGTAIPLLETAMNSWKRSEKSAGDVLAQQPILTTIGQTLQIFNASNPELLEAAEQVAAIKLQAGSNAREVAASAQLVMLTQRLGKNLNEFLSGEGVNPETAFLLGKDTNTFRETLDGLMNGSDALRLTAATDAETRSYLQQLSQRFEAVQKTTQTILQNLPGLIAAKRAQQQIFNDNEALRGELSTLQTAYSDGARYRPWTLGATIVSALSTLIFLAGLAALYLRDSRVRALEAEAREREAEARRLDEKRNNDATQKAILQLMNELQDIADGDLTRQATVTEDITGAIADSVNYTVEELKELVGRVQQTAVDVQQASSQVQETSVQLAATTEEQSRQIRQTGESVVEMADRITQVSRGAAESANVARASLAAAEQGQQAVENAITGMNGIRDQIQETSKRIKRLGESSQEIGEIVELISDITEQTNVLALNAAIQAASAGEAGRGFSVVAEEVQRLAERSGEATKQIGALIRTIQTDTQDAVHAMERSTQGVVEGARLSDNAGAALVEIGRVSRQLAELIEQISQTTSHEAGLATNVARHIDGILQVTAQTTSGTRQTATSVRQLTALTEELRNSVSRFKIA